MDNPICAHCRRAIRGRGAPKLSLGKPISLALPETLEAGLIHWGEAHGVRPRSKIARRLIEIGLEAERAREATPTTLASGPGVQP